MPSPRGATIAPTGPARPRGSASAPMPALAAVASLRRRCDEWITVWGR